MTNTKFFEPTLTFFIIIYSLLALLALIGLIFSLSVIIITYRHRHCRTIPNLLCCNSCLCGILYCTMMLINVLYGFLPNYYRQEPISCQIRGIILGLACSSKAYSYLVQAINRYIYAVHYNKRYLLVNRSTYILLIIHWSVSIIFPLPNLFFNGIAYQIETRLCIITMKRFPTALYTVISFFFIPIVSITLLYAIILIHCRSKARKTMASKRRTSFSTKSRDLKLFQNILILICILGVGGFPCFILLILDEVEKTYPSWYLIVVLFLSLSVSFEMAAIFFLNKRIKHIFYNSIGFNHQENVQQERKYLQINMPTSADRYQYSLKSFAQPES
ncbi:unnamed protein product [Didymodactylos carnosus]|uniref:G-protein coupled receptors family 1 profile domain-containing protein n=1 Tax=Didymodactylos carnosus TaxID=1234261 RepID=A0A814S9R8_9BILA|nr:unnamed protein product [Didymodactylos carnosus]CAF1530063.1 unnamed protein product [Didymodactylos carnosus]CAF3908731.1 unnamed protein product [Didymodactylos carnosus]CAF4317015.1 unnamed protein product [Didymodactylos carnosus]